MLFHALAQECDVDADEVRSAKGQWVSFSDLGEIKLTYNAKKYKGDDVRNNPLVEVEFRPHGDTEPEVVQKDVHFGLFILGTEKHESRRIDNQLRGRAGRQ